MIGLMSSETHITNNTFIDHPRSGVLYNVEGVCMYTVFRKKDMFRR